MRLAVTDQSLSLSIYFSLRVMYSSKRMTYVNQLADPSKNGFNRLLSPLSAAEAV